jgi:hypothetical protein
MERVWIADPCPQISGDGNFQCLKFWIWNNPGYWTLSKVAVCLLFTFSSVTAVFFAWISESLSPTPRYNSSILQDLIMDANEEYRATILERHPNLKDGILLLKVWLRQRGLDQVSSLNLLFLVWVVLIDGMWLFCRWHSDYFVLQWKSELD